MSDLDQSVDNTRTNSFCGLPLQLIDDAFSLETQSESLLGDSLSPLYWIEKFDASISHAINTLFECQSKITPLEVSQSLGLQVAYFDHQIQGIKRRSSGVLGAFVMINPRSSLTSNR